MGLKIVYEKGQTPLSDEDMEGLLIRTITTRGELNELEQLNIQDAVEWTLRRTFAASSILTTDFVRELHKRMYRDVWRWAGEYRKSDTSIGISWYQIAVSTKNLVDDAMLWVKNNEFSPDEFAIRFKHKIVSIHCFPNGNGRHSRLMADVIIDHIFKLPIFTWGRANLTEAGTARTNYLDSLAAADKGDYAPLLSFARS